MAQYDVYRIPRATARSDIPYLLDLQSDLLDEFATRIVAPLMLEGTIERVGRLHPIFTVEGLRVVLATDRLAAVQRRDLGNAITSLDAHHSDIIAAIDILWTGV